jgi:PAS domain S-box-containing protein
MQERCRDLSQLAKSDVHQKALVAKFLRLVNKTNSTIRTWQTGRTPSGHFDSDKLDDMMRSSVRDFSAILDTAMQMDTTEQQATDKSPMASADLRKDIWITFAAMLLVSILGAIALGIYYANGIRGPLLRLTKNSRLLSQRLPLPIPLSSQDEFGELDRLLHVVSGAVEEALDREREMLSNAADMIWSLDQDGAVKSVNPFTEELLGIRAESIIGRSWLKFVSSDDCSKADECMRSACVQEATSVFDLRLTRADGQSIDSRWTVLWSKGQSSFFCIVHDITEQRNLERLKQDYINMVSDDLRSPLMAIQGSLTLIAQGATGPVVDGVLSEVTETAKSIELLSHLINDLLDLQKLQSGKMQLTTARFALQDTLGESRDMVLSLAQVKSIHISLPHCDVQVIADQGKVRQCVVNLLSNAIKFAPPNTTVQIEADIIDDMVELRVVDRGPGVPEQYREKIFYAFEQLPASQGSAREGTGLGLAICKLIAEAHDGTIGVRPPERFTGSIFWLKIPLRHPK